MPRPLYPAQRVSTGCREAKSLSLIASAYGCTGTPVPAAMPASGGDTTCTSYAGCPRGVEVTGCSVQAGGHCWFGSDDCGTGAGFIGLAFVGDNSDTLNNDDAILAFLRRH
jgi:poly(3-hydroxybutyrate) depolymerase